jgi:hypothetical protein
VVEEVFKEVDPVPALISGLGPEPLVKNRIGLEDVPFAVRLIPIAGAVSVCPRSINTSIGPLMEAVLSAVTNEFKVGKQALGTL